MDALSHLSEKNAPHLLGLWWVDNRHILNPYPYSEGRVYTAYHPAGKGLLFRKTHTDHPILLGKPERLGLKWLLVVSGAYSSAVASNLVHLHFGLKWPEIRSF
jgi:hypothetical protein